MFNNFLSENRAVYETGVCVCRAIQATDDNMMQVHCTQDN